jgi:hypothetical protein
MCLCKTKVLQEGPSHEMKFWKEFQMDLINERCANVHRLLRYQIAGPWAAFR